MLYVITDGSDRAYAEAVSERQGWRVEHAPALSGLPENATQQLFVFKNGIRGDGLHGFQAEVFSATPALDTYSALGEVIEVTWKAGQNPTLFESAEDVLEAHKAGRIGFDETGTVLNAPQIMWPGGQMEVRRDGEITDGMAYGGGQVTEIDVDAMTVTFVAHRGWGPDGRTIYYIVTDATPSAAAESMGVPPSPPSAGLVAHSGAADMFQFKNGIRGPGPLGFQAGIAGAVPGDQNYTPMWRTYLVEWNNAESARIMETKSDIDAFRAGDMISVSIARTPDGDHVVNSPFIDPFQNAPLNG